MLLTLCAFVAGLVFGIGILVSQMASPAKVLGFLDLAGRWDPSLALVMAGAVAVGLPAFGWARKRSTTLLGAPMRLPRSAAIDRRLLGGALLFGVGWGLAGFCPGPAVVASGGGQPKAVVFVLAMLAGMLLFEFIERTRMAPPRALSQDPATTPK